MNILSSDMIKKSIEPGRIDRYLDEVEKANRNFNLYSRNLTRTDLRIFVAESLIPAELGWIDAGANNLVDIGSGWGIPAIPMLLAEISIDMTLVERSRKKADFLLLLLRRLKVTADIVCGEPGPDALSGRYDIITVRGISLGNAAMKNIKAIAGPGARIIYFGPDFRTDRFDDPQYVDYTIDNLPKRRLWTAKIL